MMRLQVECLLVCLPCDDAPSYQRHTLPSCLNHILVVSSDGMHLTHVCTYSMSVTSVNHMSKQTTCLMLDKHVGSMAIFPAHDEPATIPACRSYMLLVFHNKHAAKQ
uniref:Uncharacterized protein n=1 Tax=Dunaliella tertiolecta TaxID=3047 RepID=A0A7S3VRS0_DUNTE|eukprot:scaffold6883_cov24-Tisochrysis_lutea.AAC.1